MGTFISYNVSSNCVYNTILDYKITIFDNHCLERVNNVLNRDFEIENEYIVSEIELNSIRSILRNYAGIWSV